MLDGLDVIADRDKKIPRILPENSSEYKISVEKSHTRIDSKDKCL